LRAALFRCASAAVDEREAADLRLRLALAAAAHQQARRSADAARGEEAEAERAGGGHGQLRLQLAADVGRPTELCTKGVGGRGQREAEPEEREDRSAEQHRDPDAERGDLPLELARGELELEPDDRTGAVGDELGRAAEPGPLTSAGGHGLSNRSTWRGPRRRR